MNRKASVQSNFLLALHAGILTNCKLQDLKDCCSNFFRVKGHKFHNLIDNDIFSTKSSSAKDTSKSLEASNPVIFPLSCQALV